MTDVVVLKPHHLGRNYRDVIADKLSKKLGGKCVKHGYVKPESVKLVSVEDGKLVTNTLNGDVEFPVSLTAEVCNPPIGSLVAAKVVNSNKFGLLAHAGHVNQATQSWDVILEIVVTRQSIGFKSLVDPDAVNVNDRVLIEIVGKKFELNDTKISIIGKIVKLLTGGTTAATLAATSTLLPPDLADDEIASDEDAESEDNLNADAESSAEEDEDSELGDSDSNSAVSGEEGSDQEEEEAPSIGDDDKSSIELENSDSLAGEDGEDGGGEEGLSDDGSSRGGGRDYLD